MTLRTHVVFGTATLLAIGFCINLGCGAQLFGSVSAKPADGGRTEVDVCLGIIAAQHPEHLTAATRASASAAPTAVATVLPAVHGVGVE